MDRGVKNSRAATSARSTKDDESKWGHMLLLSSPATRLFISPANLNGLIVTTGFNGPGILLLLSARQISEQMMIIFPIYRDIS